MFTFQRPVHGRSLLNTNWENYLFLNHPPHSFISAQLISNHIVSLPIENRHVFRVGEIPLHHRDPFDRMLIAQAQVESMALLTADPVILKYEVKSIWASRLKPSHLTRRQPLRKN